MPSYKDIVNKKPREKTEIRVVENGIISTELV